MILHQKWQHLSQIPGLCFRKSLSSEMSILFLFMFTICCRTFPDGSETGVIRACSNKSNNSLPRSSCCTEAATNDRGYSHEPSEEEGPGGAEGWKGFTYFTSVNTWFHQTKPLFCNARNITILLQYKADSYTILHYFIFSWNSCFTGGSADANVTPLGCVPASKSTSPYWK